MYNSLLNSTLLVYPSMSQDGDESVDSRGRHGMIAPVYLDTISNEEAASINVHVD